METMVEESMHTDWQLESVGRRISVSERTTQIPSLGRHTEYDSLIGYRRGGIE